MTNYFGTNRQSFKEDRKARWLLIILVTILAVIVPSIIYKIGILPFIEEEALVGVFTLLVAAIGAVFVVFQLQDAERINCCNMMANLNFTYTSNPRMMKLYLELEKCYRNPGYQLEIIDDDDDRNLHTSDLVMYFTFYEVLYEYIKRRIADIEQVDDLFGDRFFKLIHNEYIQHNELYAVPSSYANIFDLYEIWYSYRLNNPQKGLMAGMDKKIPEMYWKDKLYMEETGFLSTKKEIITLQRNKNEIELELRRLFPNNIEEALKFQELVIEDIIDDDIYALTTQEELIESCLIDYCYGLFDDSKLVSVCICIANRKTNRSVAKKVDYNILDYITFDTIQVHPDYRGYGIHSFFLDRAEQYAKSIGAKGIVATVSPENVVSKNNFINADYDIVDTIMVSGGTYNNVIRDILCKEIR